MGGGEIGGGVCLIKRAPFEMRDGVPHLICVQLRARTEEAAHRRLKRRDV